MHLKKVFFFMHFRYFIRIYIFFNFEILTYNKRGKIVRSRPGAVIVNISTSFSPVTILVMVIGHRAMI